MELIVFLLLMFIFIVMMGIAISTRSYTLALISSVFLLMITIFLIVSPIVIQDGYTKVTTIDNNTTTTSVTYHYKPIEISGVDFSYILVLFFLGISIFLMIKNVEFLM